MSALSNKLLLALVEGVGEPLVVARVDLPDWPCVLSNDAFRGLSRGTEHDGKPFADVMERLLGRELALEISEVTRAGERSTIPVEIGGREFLLSIMPLSNAVVGKQGRYAVAYWRSASSASAEDLKHATAHAARRRRDASREDPVTGLLNDEVFQHVLEHDWAVAAREKTALGLIAFGFDDYRAYLDVFGPHATDSSLKRVAQMIRRSLRRASDVAARVEGESGPHIVVLSHGSTESQTRAFAVRIAAAVRELGLHHPRSRVSKFVTVSFDVAVVNPSDRGISATDCLSGLLRGEVAAVA